jgi:hypothetical protein
MTGKSIAWFRSAHRRVLAVAAFAGMAGGTQAQLSVEESVRGIRQACASEIAAWLAELGPSYLPGQAEGFITANIEQRAKAARPEMEKDLAEAPRRIRVQIALNYTLCLDRARLAQLDRGTVAAAPSPASPPASLAPAPTPPQGRSWVPRWGSPTYYTELVALERALADSRFGNRDAAKADLQKQCAAEIKAYERTNKSTGSSVVNVLVSNALSSSLENLEGDARSPENSEDLRLRVCLAQRRLWQHETALAAAQSTTANSDVRPGGGPDSVRPSNATELARSKAIAGNGKSAKGCVQLIVRTAGDPKTAGGGRVLLNNCGAVVEVSWCYTDNECRQDRGNQTTLSPGRSWPVSAERELRYGACYGANTIETEKGTSGTRYICYATDR